MLLCALYKKPGTDVGYAAIRRASKLVRTRGRVLRLGGTTPPISYKPPTKTSSTNAAPISLTPLPDSQQHCPMHSVLKYAVLGTTGYAHRTQISSPNSDIPLPGVRSRYWRIRPPVRMT
eukprot:2478960-Rhodomonas_salina.3